MSFLISCPKVDGSSMEASIELGECYFVLGANGTGKSSLMQRIFSTYRTNAVRILAHRQTWFNSNSLEISSLQKREYETHIANNDANPQSRWRDDYSSQRATIALYDLIDAENIRARAISNAVDLKNMDIAVSLEAKDALIKQINELLKLSSIPISISVHASDQIIASRNGGVGYSIAELSHGRCSLWIRLTGIAFLSLGLSLPVAAQSLSDLLAIAIKDEPTYQGTVAELRAAQARNRQMIGAFLPQITASVNTNANQRGYLTRDLNVLEQKDRYNSHSWQVNLSQPLWRYSAIADKEQAKALVGKAKFELAAAEQMLFSKVVEAWLDVLMARDQHNFTLRQEQAAQQQLAMMERGSVLGVHGLPQREEAYSKYLQSQAETQMALADIEIKRAALEQLTGTLKSLNLPTLRDNLQLSPLEASSLPDWLNTIIVHNPDIEAARKARDAAREDVSKQIAGFIPTIDLIGNYTQNSQAVGGFPGQNGYDITQSYVGLQANWALFNGGSQFAKVQEAKALLEKAEYALENTRRTVMNNSKQAWYSGLVSQAKIRASQQEMIATNIALTAARQGTQSGLKSELDILQAQQQRYAAQRDLAKGYYQQLIAMIKLKTLAGTVTHQDIAMIDGLFIDDAQGSGQ